MGLDRESEDVTVFVYILQSLTSVCGRGVRGAAACPPLSSLPGARRPSMVGGGGGVRPGSRDVVTSEGEFSNTHFESH